MLRDVFAPGSGALPVLCPKIVPNLNWSSKSLRVNLHCCLYSMLMYRLREIIIKNLELAYLIHFCDVLAGRPRLQRLC